MLANEITLFGGEIVDDDVYDPTPIAYRGWELFGPDTKNYIQFSAINFGVAWTVLIWYKAFDEIPASGNTPSQPAGFESLIYVGTPDGEAILSVNRYQAQDQMPTMEFYA